MKKFKKPLSLLLALVMLFALILPTFAAGKDTLVYTALGDSASNGYGMQEYGSRTYIYGKRFRAHIPLSLPMQSAPQHIIRTA